MRLQPLAFSLGRIGSVVGFGLSLLLLAVLAPLAQPLTESTNGSLAVEMSEREDAGDAPDGDAQIISDLVVVHQSTVTNSLGQERLLIAHRVFAMQCQKFDHSPPATTW